MTKFLRLWPVLAAAGQMTVVCGVLLGSLTYQFVLGELPCPLCVLQRMCFLLACVGPLGILKTAGMPDCTMRYQARGFVMTILASLLGAAVSIRQVLLHIVPPDPGYGPPVLGMHLYTWALIVFICLIASSAIAVLEINDNSEPLPPILAKSIICLFLTIAAVVVVATFAMEGFHLLLPDNPVKYELFG